MAAVSDYDLIAFTHRYAGGGTEQRVATAVVVNRRVRVFVWRVEADGQLTKLIDSGTGGMAATSVGHRPVRQHGLRDLRRFADAPLRRRRR